MRAEESIQSEAETRKLAEMHALEQQENNDNVDQMIIELQEELIEKQ